MKKFFIGITIFGGAIFLLIIIARLTNALQFYHGVSTSMSPAIEPNGEFFSSNLVKPKHHDIIVFKRETDIYDGAAEPGHTAIFTYRLIAMGGEKLEIKNGLAYVNDKLADDSTKLKFYYTFSAKNNLAVIPVLYPGKTEPPESEWTANGDDSTVVLCTYPQYIAAQKITPLTKFFHRTAYTDTSLYLNNNSKNWSTHNYGPVIIPAHHYFLLGDNRDGARDSRFIGPVKEEKVTGVVIGK